MGTSGRLNLTRSMSRSVESPTKLTALFLIAFLMVVQMSPGRWNGWFGVIGVVWPG